MYPSNCASSPPPAVTSALLLCSSPLISITVGHESGLLVSASSVTLLGQDSCCPGRWTETDTVRKDRIRGWWWQGGIPMRWSIIVRSSMRDCERADQEKWQWEESSMWLVGVQTGWESWSGHQKTACVRVCSSLEKWKINWVKKSIYFIFSTGGKTVCWPVNCCLKMCVFFSAALAFQPVFSSLLSLSHSTTQELTF